MMQLPFRDIITTRPYPKTGLTTARWIAEVEPKIVYFSDLTLTQNGVRIAPLWGVRTEHASADTLPHVVYWNHRYYLEDGHHRVVREALYGVRTALMRVYTYEKPIILPSQAAGGRFV